MKLKPTNLNIRASSAEKAMLDQVAQANETTPSEMMRQLIRDAHAKLQENPMKHFAIKNQDGLESPYRHGEVAVYDESAVKAIVAHGERKSFLRQFQGKPVDPANIKQVSGGATYHTRRMNPQSSTASHAVKFVEVEIQ